MSYDGLMVVAALLINAVYFADFWTTLGRRLLVSRMAPIKKAIREIEEKIEEKAGGENRKS